MENFIATEVVHRWWVYKPTKQITAPTLRLLFVLEREV